MVLCRARLAGSWPPGMERGQPRPLDPALRVFRSTPTRMFYIF